MHEVTQATIQSSSGWLAQLDLTFARRVEKTVIARRQHVGPLTVQRAFYPEGDVCHAYILHPPGGVVGGDRLALNVSVESAAHALLTTPASAKFYRSASESATQAIELHVADNAVLEYFPQDTILFDACRVNTATRVHLESGARFAGWEILCQGRPASGEKFIQGQCLQAYEVYQEQMPLLIERTRLTGNSSLQAARWGLAGYAVTATMVVTGANSDMLILARQALNVEHELCGVSLINGILVCRYLGHQGLEARDHLARVWEAIRPAWIGRQASRPRIWDT